MKEVLEMAKRWYRSRRDRMIAGVCGGLAELLGVDSALVRFIWGITIFFGGFGVFAYILAMIVIPESSESDQLKGAVPQEVPPKIKGSDWGIIFGVFVVVAGALLLLSNFLGWFIWNWSWKIMVPVILIGFGAYLIFRAKS
jgi:phage shock protein PspC (stress-responsive transcriptional regulator)